MSLRKCPERQGTSERGLMSDSIRKEIRGIVEVENGLVCVNGIPIADIVVMYLNQSIKVVIERIK